MILWRLNWATSGVIFRSNQPIYYRAKVSFFLWTHCSRCFAIDSIRKKFLPPSSFLRLCACVVDNFPNTTASIAPLKSERRSEVIESEKFFLLSLPSTSVRDRHKKRCTVRRFNFLTTECVIFISFIITLWIKTWLINIKNKLKLHWLIKKKLLRFKLVFNWIRKKSFQLKIVQIEWSKEKKIVSSCNWEALKENLTEFFY